MADSHCEILWDDNSGAGLGRHPTENHEAGLDDPQNWAIIDQQRLSSNVLGIWIDKSLTTYAKRKLRAFRSAYNFNNQYYGSAIIFVIVKKVPPDIWAGFLDIISKLDNMKMSQFKHNTPKSNLKIA